MSEEIRTTETRTPAGDTHTTTTHVVRDGETASGGGGKWVLLLVVAVLAVLAFVAFTQMSDAEIAKDNAVAGAADDVGEAAGQVGDAAQDAADNLTE